MEQWLGGNLDIAYSGATASDLHGLPFTGQNEGRATASGGKSRC